MGEYDSDVVSEIPTRDFGYYLNIYNFHSYETFHNAINLLAKGKYNCHQVDMLRVLKIKIFTRFLQIFLFFSLNYGILGDVIICLCLFLV